MGFVSCPNCDEDVRLPSADLPEGFSAQCPWCAETFPASSWTAKLPPAVQLIAPNGAAVEWNALSSTDQAPDQATDQKEHFENAEDVSVGTDHAPVVDAAEVDSLELEIEPFEPTIDDPVEIDDPEETDVDDDLLLAQSPPETSEDLQDTSEDNAVSEEEAPTGFELQYVDDGSEANDSEADDSESSNDQHCNDDVQNTPAENTPAVGLHSQAESTEPAATGELPDDEFAVERFLEKNVFQESTAVHADEGEEEEFDEHDFDDDARNAPTELLDHEPTLTPPAEPLRVPLASEAEQLSYYQRHEWTRESRTKRTLKYLIPAILLLPIAGAALAYAVGPSKLGLSFLGDFSSLTASVRNLEGNENVSQTAPSTRLSDSTRADDIQNTSRDEPESDLLDSAPSADGNSPHAVSAVEALTRPDDATDNAVENDSSTPAEEDPETAEGAAPANYKSPTEDIDAWIDSVIEGPNLEKPETKTVTAEAAVEPPQTAGTSIADLVRAHSEKVAAKKAMQRSAEVQRKNQERSLMLFPKEAPKISETRDSATDPASDPSESHVKQASAVDQIELPTHSKTGSNSDLKELPELPAEMSKVSPETGKNSAPDASSLWAVPEDSPELERVCGNAVLSLQRFEKIVGSTDPADVKWKQTALVRAYRDVAIIGAEDFDAYSVAVSKVMSQIAKPHVLSAMEPLGTAWVDYPKRKTDGILLIGTLNGDGRSGTLELPSGAVFHVQYDGVTLADGENVFAVGKILSKGKTPQVRLVAGNVVPSPP